MKVCLVASNSLDVSPYVKKYADFLKKENICFDIIEKKPKCSVENKNLSPFVFAYSEASTKVGKLLRFAKFAAFVRDKIKANHYDCVVLFSPTNSTFCYMLCRKYLKNRYMVDLRDYEKIVHMPLLKNCFNACVKNAEIVTVSSKKFLSWMPSDCSAFVMHNLPNDVCRKEHTSSFQTSQIRIGYLGGIGYYAENVALVNALKESERFQIVYHGIYPQKDNIKDYCLENKISNATFFGKYSNEEKPRLYEEIDFINAVYGNSSLIVTTALPNKLYDCVCYKIPIIVSKGTYLAELVEDYGIGIAIDVMKDDIEKALVSFIERFDSEAFDRNCDVFFEKVICEQKETDAVVSKFLKGIAK